MWPVIFIFTLLLLLLILAKKRNASQRAPSATKAQVTAHRTRLPKPRLLQPSTPPSSVQAMAQLTTATLVMPTGQIVETEAKLNHALKQDPTQYRLYLELLDLYLAEADEIAIQRLLRHIQTLQQPQLLQQALAQQQRQASLAHTDVLNTQLQQVTRAEDLNLPVSAPESAAKTSIALIEPIEPTKPTKPQGSHPTAQTTSELPPIEFSSPTPPRPQAQVADLTPQSTAHNAPSPASDLQSPPPYSQSPRAAPEAWNSNADLEFELSPLDLSTWQAQPHRANPDSTVTTSQYSRVQRQLDLAAHYLDQEDIESASLILVPELIAVDEQQGQYLAQLSTRLAIKLLG